MTTHTQAEAKSTSTLIPVMQPAYSGLLPQQEQEDSNRSLLPSEDRLRSPSSPTPPPTNPSVGHSFGTMAIGPTTSPVLQRAASANQTVQRQETTEEEENKDEEESVQAKALESTSSSVLQRIAIVDHTVQRQENPEEEEKQEEEPIQAKAIASLSEPFLQRQGTAEAQEKDKTEPIQAKAFSGQELTSFSQRYGQMVAETGVKSASKIPLVQRKLTIGQANDEYEEEADRVAEQVMRMSEPESLARQIVSPSQFPTLQREREDREAEQEEEKKIQMNPLSASMSPTVQRQEIQDEEKEKVQTKPSPQPTPENNTSEMGHRLTSQLNTSKGSGEHLLKETRTFMEPRFGVDFGQVRIHTDHQAAQMNRELGAQAFTHGRDIYFGAGKYNTRSNEGKKLLAHELTHVIQQNKVNLSLPKGFSAAHNQLTRSLAASVSTIHAKEVQAAPTVTGITVGTEIGIGRNIRATAQVAPGTPRNTALNWSLVGPPAGATITPQGRTATIQSVNNAAALAAAGGTFQVRCALAATPGDNFTSPNITLVGITGITFTAAPVFANQPIAGGGTAVFPPNTVDPNRDGLVGNTATVNIVTVPAARATVVTLPTGLGATVVGNVITPGQRTGNITVRVTDNATSTHRDETLTVNPVPLSLSGFPATAGPAIVGVYGALNTIAWRSSDRTGVLNRVVGETMTPGGRDDLSLMPGFNGIGPNPAPIPALAVPANTWQDQLYTPISFITAAPITGVRGGGDIMDVNNYVGPGVAARLPRVSIIRQGFHHQGWTGAWSNEFDHGIHRRSLRGQPGNFSFLTEHIFPGARTQRPELYAGPPLIVLSNVTVTPAVPAAAGLAADGVATANLTVNSTVAGRNVIWTVLEGTIAFTVPALGAAAPVGNAATIQAGRVAGRSRVRIADSIFPNRQADANVQVVPVRLRGIRAPRTVPSGTLTANVNLVADPGGRTINWTVDSAAAGAGVTIAGVAPVAPVAPARTATVTKPAAFIGRVTATARDSVLPAVSASTVITFR